MSKKLHWFRHYAKDYLGDPAIMGLSHQAKGLLLDINSILWAHTDRQGYYVVNGQIGTFDELLTLALSYSTGPNNGRRRAARWSLAGLQKVGHLAKGTDGIIYSKYLVNLIANSELQSERGRKGGNPAITKDKIRVNQGLNLESESEEEEEERERTLSSSPSVKSQVTPATEEDDMTIPDTPISDEIDVWKNYLSRLSTIHARGGHNLSRGEKNALAEKMRSASKKIDELRGPVEAPTLNIGGKTLAVGESLSIPLMVNPVPSTDSPGHLETGSLLKPRPAEEPPPPEDDLDRPPDPEEVPR